MKTNLTLRFTKFTTDVFSVLTGLPTTVDTTIIKRQLIRAVTSVGANYFESQHAASKADFINKLHIASKELYETIYWLEVLKELQSNNPILKSRLLVSLDESDQLRRILTSCILTAKGRKKDEKEV